MPVASHFVRFSRGWGVCSGLAILLGTACSAGGPGPLGEPVADFEPPVVDTVDGSTWIRNRGPSELLTVYRDLPATGLTLLFLQGRSATPDGDGGSAWADMEGGRVVRFDRNGVVQQLLGGAPDDGPPLTRPAFVAFERGSLLAVEIDGGALRFADGEAEGWLPAPMPGPIVGGAGRPVAAVRTVFDLRIAPLMAAEPLLWLSGRSGDVRPIGRIRMPEQAMLAPLVNSGWVAPTEDGAVVFASAVRPELQRFSTEGDLEWIATWSRDGVAEPTFGISEGTLVPRFRLIQQAIVVGTDGRIYVLVTSGEEGPADRLLVFDAEGRLLRAGDVDPRGAIYVGRFGHIYAAEDEDALARTEASASAVPFEAFVLPELGGEGEVRLADHRGKVVVVNFWASWCAPCRQEMPLLDDFARELDPGQAVVIGLNEDVVPENGLRFLHEIGGVGYAVGEGLGRLRERYGYRGLPYTVIIDRDGKLAKALYGFGSSIDPIRRAALAVIDSDARAH